MKLLINGSTIGEHISYRSTTEYELKREIGKLENLLNHLKRHRRLYFKLVLIVSMMIMSGYINPVLAMSVDVNQAINRINKLGNELLKLVRAIAYWTVLLITSKDCIKDALTGDKRSVGNAIVKGLIIMATIYFLPEMFALMESIVEG